MRRLALLLILATHQTALAEEPLLLRIRPNHNEDEFGRGSAASPEAIARQAWLAREAVWERSRRNAEIAIASICTGCLKEPTYPPVNGMAGGDPGSRLPQTTQLGP